LLPDGGFAKFRMHSAFLAYIDSIGNDRGDGVYCGAICLKDEYQNLNDQMTKFSTARNIHSLDKLGMG